MLLLRGLWSLFAAAMALIGVILANYGADVLLTRISTLETAARESLLFRIGFNVVGGLLGFLLGLKSFRRLIAWANYMETVSLLDKITTVVGILIGLVVAILASTPFANVAGVGLPIRIFACIVGIVLGIGFATSAKEQVIYVFPGLAPERTEGIVLTTASLAKMLDTNIIIDGRIADIAATGFLEGPIVVPGFVLQELRHIAGSSDGLKRARGRRGLDMLNRLNQLDSVRVEVVEDYPKGLDQTEEVDQRLVSFAELVGACVVTNDYGVNEIAKLKSVPVLNVNELANAMKPVYLPGEDMSVALVKEGKEPGQGVAYLDDGTMVVVEGGASALGQTVAVVVTSVLQTTAGKMIFSELLDEDGHSPTVNGGRRKRERK